MDKGAVVYIHCVCILSHQKERNFATCNGMGGTRRHSAKQNKSVREGQIPYDFTHMWNLRNKTDEHGGGERKIKQDEN